MMGEDNYAPDGRVVFLPFGVAVLDVAYIEVFIDKMFKKNIIRSCWMTTSRGGNRREYSREKTDLSWGNNGVS
jgi:hypothetical protein